MNNIQVNMSTSALCFFLTLLSASAQKFSNLDKEYFLIKELKTFDDAITMCKNRNERLVQINSQAENEFIFNTIVKPTGNYVSLGATNAIGSKTFKWLDGSDLVYTNWYNGNPTIDSNQRTSIVMLPSSGKWYYYRAGSYSSFVICEKTAIIPQPQPADPPECNASQLENQLLVINNTIIEHRNEYLKLIMDAKQASDIKFDQMVEISQKNSNSSDLQMADICNLQWQANDLAFELKLSKQQSNVQITQLRKELEITMNLTEQLQIELNSNQKQNEQLIQKNELFEVRLDRVEQKTSNGFCMGREI